MTDNPHCTHCNDTGWTQYRNEYVKLGRVPCTHCETGADEQRRFKAAIARIREQMERDEQRRGDATDGVIDYSGDK